MKGESKMAKYLVFKNGATEEFTDESTITNLFCVVNSYAAIDAMQANFTTENMEEQSLTASLSRTLFL